MVAPVVIAAGIMAATSIATAIAQWQSSEQARNASAAERQRMADLLAQVKSPNFDPKSITPQDYAVVRKHVPQVAQYVAELAPSLVKADSADAKAGREAQMAALNRLRNLSNTGTDEQSMMLQQEATSQANIANRGRQGAIQEDFARRGAGGSGLELLAQMSNAQNVNDMQASNSRSYAMEAYKNKLQALRDAANLGTGIRQEDIDLESRNNDVLNSFNQRTSVNRNNHNRYVADTYNDADRLNLTNEQDVANRNTTGANQAAFRHQDRQDHIAQAGYDNEMSKLKVQAGISDSARADARDSARDRNSAIGGAGDAAQTAIAYYGANSKQPAAASLDESNKKTTVDANDPLTRKYRTSNYV